MLFTALLVGIVAGFAVGGRLDNLAGITLRWPVLIVGAVAVRILVETTLGNGATAMEAFRLPLLAATYILLAAGLWKNRQLPGMSLALVGIAANATAIIANGGYMPVWEPALRAAGFDVAPAGFANLHVLLPPTIDLRFLAAAGPLGDVVPIPLPFVRNVLSLGDVVLASGLTLFIFTGLVRAPEDQPAAFRRAAAGSAGAAGAAAQELPVSHTGGAASIGRPRPARAPGPQPALARVRSHPYVRLVGNGSFMSLWIGNLVSLFGDRIHQIALVFLVGSITGSAGAAIAVSFVFVASTIPNLLFGAPVGVLVDRWNQKHVMLASDLLRAVLVLLIPPAAGIHVALVYPLVFVIATLSIFFRPARSAVLPRIVTEDELVTANSAGWLGETLADVVGYPLAGLFVAFLSSALPLAFWLDAATYLVSAALIAVTRIPPVPAEDGAETDGGERFADQLRAGLRFLRNEPVLWANTLQAVVAQFTIGASIALSPIYASRILAAPASAATEGPAIYGLMETFIGLGSLLGGFVVGLIGRRIRRGLMVIVGYAAYGISVVVLGLTGNTVIAVALSFGMGIANMIFVIPSQTLFQERTPAGMMGRVLSFRFSVVFGSMTLAMAISGFLGEAIGVQGVFVAFGLITTVAGIAGIASRELRRA